MSLADTLAPVRQIPRSKAQETTKKPNNIIAIIGALALIGISSWIAFEGIADQNEQQMRAEIQLNNDRL
jgi:hypothetical protein